MPFFSIYKNLTNWITNTQRPFALEMDEHVTVEDTIIEVSLPTTSGPSCSVSHSVKVEDELFCADLNQRVKHENSGIHSSNQQLNFEAPDIKLGIVGGDHEVCIKLEPFKSEELQIKDEIDQSRTDGTAENITHFENFYCDLCNSKCTSKSRLRQHIKIHTGEKQFKCGFCDYKSAKKSTLSRHIKTHTGEKPYKCGTCDYRCVQKGTLASHMKSHASKREFKCDFCDFRSARKSGLTSHIKTHNRDNPYKCNICDFRSARKSGLTSHIKTHNPENPYKCNMCDKFMQKSYLARHIKTHTVEKPFKCGVCNYGCAQKSSLSQHMKTHFLEIISQL